MKHSLPLLSTLFLGAAAASHPPVAPPSTETPPGAAVNRSTFADDLAFLKGHAPVRVLAAPSGARVAVSGTYQGRVMTSAVEADGASLGWINRAFITAGRTGTAFDNYGGEDRFWLGPEGGQYGLYFPPGMPFDFVQWRTPAAFQEGAWLEKDPGSDEAVFTRALEVTNYSGSHFALEVERRVRLLSDADAGSRLGIDLQAAKTGGAKWVAFETVNRITNRGPGAWTRDHGLLSIWILAMYAPSPDAHVLIPFERSGTGPIVNDAYFGKVPLDRLSVREPEGYLVFKCDGHHRSKIGLRPARARTCSAATAPPPASSPSSTTTSRRGRATTSTACGSSRRSPMRATS